MVESVNNKVIGKFILSYTIINYVLLFIYFRCAKTGS